MFQSDANKHVIYLLWLNWVMVAGSISLLVILSLWLSPILVPLVAFAMQFGFIALLRSNIRHKMSVCYLLPSIAARIMFITGVIMLVVSFFYQKGWIYRLFDATQINTEIPFITVLIISPVTFFTSLYASSRQVKLRICEQCQALYGTPGERGFLGHLFSLEGKYQLRMLRNLSGLCTVVAWAYYLLYYVNVNLNAPDRFVFFWAPIALFAFSIIYMGVKYAGLYQYYTQDMGSYAPGYTRSTTIRYLMFWDDYLCVLPPQLDPDKAMSLDKVKYDTPGSIHLSYRERVTVAEAKEYFCNFAKLADADVRYMYSNLGGNADSNVFHFLVFLTDEEKEVIMSNHPSYEFISLSDVDRLLNSGRFALMLSAEIVRLHTVAMAWRTYDTEGRRLYKIKNYVPSFRLRDIKKWNVDYDDPHWITVSRLNADKPFFRLRRWLHNLTLNEKR